MVPHAFDLVSAYYLVVSDCMLTALHGCGMINEDRASELLSLDQVMNVGYGDVRAR